MMPAAAAGPKLAWLDPAEDVGVRLWFAAAGDWPVVFQRDRRVGNPLRHRAVLARLDFRRFLRRGHRCPDNEKQERS